MNENIIVTASAETMRGWGRQALAGIWSKAVLGTLLYYLLTMVPVLILNLVFDEKAVEFAANLYFFIVSGPLLLGYTVFMIAIFRKQPTTPTEVFYGFERFGKTLGLYFMMNLFIMLWALLLIVPGIIAALRYSMAFYIMADNPDIGIMDAISESKRMMRGNKWKYFCLQLSFFGWALLACLTMGIGFFWLTPYIYTSTVGFYEIANGNLKPRMPEIVQETTQNSTPESVIGEIAAPKENSDDELKIEVRTRQ